MADIQLFGLTVGIGGAVESIRTVGVKSDALATQVVADNSRIASSVQGLSAIRVASDARVLERQAQLAKLMSEQSQAAQVEATKEMARLAQSEAAIQHRTAAAQDAYQRETRAMGLLEIQAYKMDAALLSAAAATDVHAASTVAATAAGGAHGLQLGRLRMELGTLVGRLTGTSTALDRMAGAMGGMAFGNPIVIGVLAGIAAVGYAYEKFTEKARTAQKQAEETRKEFEKIAHMDVRGQGEAASLLYSGDPFSTNPLAIASLKELERQRADFERREAAGVRMSHDDAFSLTKDAQESAKALIEVNRELERRQKLLASITGPGGSLTRAGTAQAAADLPGFVTDQTKAREQAEKAAARAAEQEWKQALQQRMDEQNHFIKEQQAAYKTAGEDAVKEFESEQDRETAIALQQQNEQARNAKAAYREQGDAAVRVFDEQEKYARDMHKEWLRGIERITTTGLTSFRSFFESVYGLFTHMMSKMEADGKTNGFGYKALGLGSAAIGGGLAGYQIGSASASGNKGSAALFGAGAGALSGAAAGSAIMPGVGTAIGAAVGAIAGLAGGIIGAGHAADLSAHEMDKLRVALATSIESVKATISGDALGQALASLKSQFDTLRKNAEDAYAYGKNEAERNQKLAELNALEAQRIAQVNAEAEIVRRYAQEDLQARMLTAQGRTVEAEAMAFAHTQQREMAAALKDTTEAGRAYTATLGLVQEAEKQAHDTAIRKAAEDKKAAEVEVARVSLASSSARLLAAQGQTWAAQQMQMAESQKTEMDGLIKSMGATVDPLAVAALAAAQAAEKAAAAWQHVQDVINQGTSHIAQQAGVFGLSPQDAFDMETQNFGFGGMTPDQIKAKYTTWKPGLELTPEQRSLNDHIATWINDFNKLNPAGLGGGANSGGVLSSSGATQAVTAVSAVVTEHSALMLVDLARSEVSLLTDIRNDIRRNGGTGGGGGGLNITNHYHFGADVGPEVAAQIAREIEHQIGTIDEKLGGRFNLQHIYTGSVGR